MVTDTQVRKLMRLIREGNSMAIAAAKSGMDEKTARKYAKQRTLPSATKGKRTWRTREDGFKEVWPEIEEILRSDGAVEANTIFEHLCRKYEGRFSEGSLRTLQRRVKEWRARWGPEKEVMFPQVHKPGRQGQSDFTHMGGLGITIQGQAFDHLVYHFALSYSNWESVTVCFSESFESLAAGLQNALWELGGVPEEHRTDSLSAAINNLSDPKEWTDRYKGLMSHYGLEPSHNTPGRGHENGDVEQSHNRFKRAVEQELILRGSREFESRDQYEQFLRRLVKRRNAARTGKLKEEVAVMRNLPDLRAEDFTRGTARVTRNSTVNVKRNIYSVNSQLIGEKVDIRLYAERVEVWYGGQMVQLMPRLKGAGGHAINYRHVIHSLVKKPGAFAQYRYQSDMFPAMVFRVAYDYLLEHSPDSAERQYVKILKLAADEGQQRVEAALRELIDRGEIINVDQVKELVSKQDQHQISPAVEILPIELSAYDVLLGGEEVERWAIQ